MTTRRILLFCSSLFSLTLCFVLFFLLATESGLGFLQQRVNRSSQGTLTIGQVTGRLLGEFSLSNVRYRCDGLDLNLKQLDFGWHPAKVLKGDLHLTKVWLTGLDIFLKDDSEQGKTELKGTDGSTVGENETIHLPSELIPFGVVLEDFRLDQFQLKDTDDYLLLALDTGKARLQISSERLTINEFDFQGPELGLNIHGNIEVWQDWQLELMGKWHLAGYGFHHMEGTFYTNGPLMNPHVEVGLHDPVKIRVVGDLVNLLEKPEWTARLEAEDSDLSKWIKYCPQIEISRADGDLHGDFGSYIGQVRADVDWHTLKGMQLVTDIVGSGWGIDFTSLKVKNAEGSARAEGGNISWRNIFSWEGHFWFKNFDPLFFSDQLQGRLNAELINKGDVTEEANVITTFDIRSLDGLLRGHPVGAVGTILLDETEVRTEGLVLSSGELEGLARIESGLYSWAQEPAWAGQISFEKFDPSSLYPSFPGSISGKVRGEGKASGDSIEGWLKIEDISGLLRENKISGGGEIRLSSDNFHTNGLYFKSGSSELKVKGGAGEKMGLEFSLLSPDLKTLQPWVGGQLDLKGSLQGNLRQPQLDMKLQGREFTYREERIDRLWGEVQTDFYKNGEVFCSLQGEGISVHGLVADRSAIDLSGRLANHQVKFSSEGRWGSLGFLAKGGLGGIGKRAETGTLGSGWQGNLSGLHLDLTDSGQFSQQEDANLVVGTDLISLDRFCLALAMGEGKACFAGDMQFKDELTWTIDAALSALPLVLFNQIDSELFQLTGGLNGHVTGNGNMEGVVVADAELLVEDGDLLLNVGEGVMEGYHLNQSSLSVTLSSGVLSGGVDIGMDHDSQLRIIAELQNAGKFSTPFQSLPLSGSLELKHFDLAIVSDFTGYGVEPTGWINNSLRLDGTLGRPEVYGDITIDNGGIYLPYQGITLENIVLSINAAGEKARVSGTATSGPGQLRAEGIVQYAQDGIEAQLNIKGKDFLLVDLPEYTIRVNPEVAMKLTRDRGEIAGRVEVPYGLITPEEMSDSVSASEDVILIENTGEERTKGWPFGLDLDVLLGEQVTVEGYGLAGRLGGELRLNTTADDTLVGKGELDLTGGTFTVYGRTLSIERGRMLFTGGPVDNPGVDVRAQVKVGDDEARGEGYTVGVDISGLVQDLEYRLFSEPFMEDTEILSLMIVGHSLAGSTEDEANLLEAAAVALGTAGSRRFVKNLGDLFFVDDLHLEGSSNKENVSLVVGKRLTKDLYIGYDLNMFSQIGQFRVRYDLKKGFSVETRSSAESTGADLLFSFER